MRERPALPDHALAACLSTGYGITPVRTTFLALGQDVQAWRFRIDATDGRSYFLKLRRAPIDERTLALPDALRASGIEQVVVPLPADDGSLWRPVDAFSVVVYPWIDGRTSMAAGLTPVQWETLGAAMRRVHASMLPDRLAQAVPRERFTQPSELTTTIRALVTAPHATHLPETLARHLSQFLRDYRDTIQGSLERLNTLGRLLRTRVAHDALVLCHADLHINNVLVDTHGRVWIVDWDQPLFALCERDLMCVLGPPMHGVLPGLRWCTTAMSAPCRTSRKMPSRCTGCHT